MVISDVITMTRLKVNDKDSIEFTDDEMLSFVNDGIRFIREIYMEEIPDMLTEVGTAELVSGENSFELPRKLLKITDIRCNGKKMHYAKIRDIANLDDTGVPNVYSLTFNNISVFPIPQKPTTISFRYILESPTYDYLDDFPYPTDFAQYVQEYAAVRVGTVIGADMSMETQVFSQLRNSVLNAIQKLVPDTCVVDSYY